MQENKCQIKVSKNQVRGFQCDRPAMFTRKGYCDTCAYETKNLKCRISGTYGKRTARCTNNVARLSALYELEQSIRDVKQDWKCM